MKKIILLIIGFALVSPSFSQLTLSDSLIAHYAFNGDANDSSGNGYNGTVYGATLTNDRFGTPNSAYEFDGIDDFIDCNSILDVSSQDTISISAWLYPQQISSNNQYSGLGFGKKTTGNLQLRVRTNTDSRFQALHADANENNITSMSGNNLFTYNQWYHLVAIYSDNSVVLYINVSAQTNNSGNGNLLSNIPQNSIFRIGKSYVDFNAQRFFKGKIDDIRVYNRLLTSSEVDSLYNESVLPVELIHFEGRLLNQQIKLNWATASESNNLGFEIQKSKNGKDWQTLDFVKGQGTSVKVNDYEYQDANPFSGINYYRLKQIDYDGAFEYSQVISVDFITSKKSIQVYPNPSDGLVNLNIENPLNQPIRVWVMDNLGREIWESGLIENEFEWRKEIKIEESGIYLMAVQIGNEISYKRHIIANE